MKNVVSLQKYRTEEIGRLLTGLLQLWEAGHIKGVAICFKDQADHEHISFLGDYRDDPAHGVSASLKMSRRINEIQDRLDGFR
jgi:hypothetical protein